MKQREEILNQFILDTLSNEDSKNTSNSNKARYLKACKEVLKILAYRI